MVHSASLDRTPPANKSRCRQCGLIFRPIDDRDVIGESAQHPGLCIICAGNDSLLLLPSGSRSRRGVEDETMNIASHEKVIKVHTLSIDDTEIERLLADPTELTDLLSQLLSTPIAPTNGDRPKHARPARRSAKHKRPRVACQYCGRSIDQGWLERHEARCPQRPPA